MNYILSILYISVCCSPFIFQPAEAKYFPTLDTSLELQELGQRLVLAALLFFLPFYILGTVGLVFGFATIRLGLLVPVQLVVAASVGLGAMRFTHSERWTVGLYGGRNQAPAAPTPGLGRFAIVGAGLVYLALGIMVSIGFPRGFEVNAYHLPIGVKFFQSGSLEVWDRAYMHTFPANMSLFTGFLLQFLPEHLVAPVNLLYLALAAFACYALGRIAGGDRDSSCWAAVGLTTIPIVAFSSLELGADVAGMAFLALSLLIVLAAPPGNVAAILLAGMSVGLAFGFKSLHLIGAGLIGSIVLTTNFLRQRDAALGRALMVAVAAGATFTLGFTITAGFWLFRNYFTFGNPLYPVHLGPIFDFLGWARAPDVDFTARRTTEYEWVRNSLEWFVYPWIEWHFIDQNFKHSSGLGAFFAAFVPVAVLTAFVPQLQLQPSKPALPLSTHWVRRLLGVVSILIALVWWVLGDRQPRYLMGAVILWVALVAPFLRNFASLYRKRLIALAVFCCVAMLVIIFSMEIFKFSSQFLVSGNFQRRLFYEYPKAVDNLPSGSVILNLGSRPYNYPLLGKGLSNQIISEFHVKSAMKKTGHNAITADLVAALGISHIFTEGALSIPLGPCVGLKEVDRLDRNPANNVPLSKPRILYKVTTNGTKCDSTAVEFLGAML